MRGLHLLVGEARGAPHQAAAEAVGVLAAAGIHAHFHEQAAARLKRLEAAPAVGQRLGQHRHHPVREVTGVAALASLPVERRTWPDVVCDIGDGDDQAKSRAVRFCEHRVIEIARVLAIDGDEREVAEVGAPTHGDGAGLLGLGDGLLGKHLRDIVGVKHHEADRFGLANAAEPFGHAGGLETIRAGGRQRFGQHEFAGLGTAFLTGRHGPFSLGTPVGRLDAAAIRAGGEHAEHAARRVRQTLEGAAFEAAGADRAQFCQYPLAWSQCWGAARFGMHHHQRRRALALPLDRAPDSVAVRVGAGDPHDGRIRQPACGGEAFMPRGRHLAAAAETFQQALESDLMLRPKTEMACDLAFADAAGGGADELLDIVAGGKASRLLFRHRCPTPASPCESRAPSSLRPCGPLVSFSERPWLLATSPPKLLPPEFLPR